MNKGNIDNVLPFSLNIRCVRMKVNKSMHKTANMMVAQMIVNTDFVQNQAAVSKRDMVAVCLVKKLLLSCRTEYAKPH